MRDGDATRWRFGEGFATCCLTLLIGIVLVVAPAMISASSGNLSEEWPAVVGLLVVGLGLIGGTVWVLRRNFVRISATAGLVTIRRSGREAAYPIGQVHFVVPEQPQLPPAYVEYRVQGGPAHPCGLLSQGRILRPLRLRAFEDHLRMTAVSWERVQS